MKIAIDCADLDFKGIDGTRVYIKNILNYLGKIDQTDQFYLYHQKEFNPLLKPEIFPNYTDAKIPYPFWWTQTRLAYEIKTAGIEALWMPIQQLPYLIEKKIKSVVTIHDLAFKFFPQYFPPNDRFKLNLFTDFAIKNATALIAISEATKQDILKFYPQIKAEKISVVHHGFDAEHFGSLRSTTQKKAVFEKFNLQTQQYILYVGAIQPRKNLFSLISAFENLKCKGVYSSEMKLVLAGAPAWLADETLKRVRISKYSKDIVLAGSVDFETLACLYQGAINCVLPSFYEGFGLPILEAFASGTPMVTANNSSLSEIGGSAVFKFETQSVESLQNALRKILKDEQLKDSLIRAGKERIKDFSWEKCAQKTLKIIKSS